MKKSFGISTEKCESFVGITLNKAKKNNFEECEKANVRPELKQKTEWPRQESETQRYKFRQLLNSNQLSKITKDHTKDAYT